MTILAQILEQDGWILRSGGAKGADKAFQDGVSPEHRQIFRPNQVTEEAIDLACKFHPLGESLRHCPDYIYNLHARNGYQVLGPDLKTPSSLVICWTQDGAIRGEETQRSTGGTGQAIRIASAHGIPVFNLARQDHLDEVRDYIFSSRKG